MKKSVIVKELNTLRIILNDLTGETDIGEYYIDVLSKAIFLLGSSKWEFTTDHFNLKCDEVAGDVYIDVYHKDTLIDERSYTINGIVSDEDKGEA